MGSFDAQKIEIVRNQMTEVMRSLVDFPDQIIVKAECGEQTVVFHTSCHSTDIGKLIGKKGKMADALRTMLASYSTRMNFRAVMQIG